jgi:hypothetical protein
VLSAFWNGPSVPKSQRPPAPFCFLLSAFQISAVSEVVP